VSFAHPEVSRWKRSEVELYIEKPRETHQPLISFFNEDPRAYSQAIINKDLDTGGYNAKTCEAERTGTHVAICPPDGGRGYTKMTTRLLDVQSSLDVQ
jgi:hypothetical protein